MTAIRLSQLYRIDGACQICSADMRGEIGKVVIVQPGGKVTLRTRDWRFHQVAASDLVPISLPSVELPMPVQAGVDGKGQLRMLI